MSRGPRGATAAVRPGVAAGGAPGTRRARRGWGSPAPWWWSVWVGAPAALVAASKLVPVAREAKPPCWPNGPSHSRPRVQVHPDVPATPATAATAVATSTTDPTAHDRLIRPDRSTVHSRDPPGQALGRPTPAMMPRRSRVRGSEGSKRPTLPACGAIRCATRPRMRHVKHGRYHAPYLRRGVRFRATASLMSALNARSLIFSPS